MSYEIDTLDECPRCGSEDILSNDNVSYKYHDVDGCFECNHTWEVSLPPELPVALKQANRKDW